nr:hypothetical protein [Tanacetum cinerariifolium]
MCDKKKGVLFTDAECLVLSPEFKLPDENQVLLRIPRENNMYIVNLNNIVPSGDLTCLFAKATLDESNLWHRRLGYVNFKTMNKLLKGEENIQQYVLFPVWSSGSINPQNTDGNAAFEVKEPEFEGRKPQPKIHVSPSSSAQSKKHDDKTKREAKGKSPVESSTRYRNLSVEFEDLSDNNINEDNVVGSLVPAIGQISTNSTNTFSAAGPSNIVEDITYSNDEDDVGAEADFNNLETTITVTPMPTTRVYKDNPVTQIIGNLSSATQTRSMTRVAKDQEPKRVHQALKDPSWIEAMQEVPNGFLGTKKDERGIIVRNKAQLVAQGHTQEDGIDYEEVFALVARIESIRLFLAYASFMGFMVYQMDVKSAFPVWNYCGRAYSDSDYAGASLDRKSTTGDVNSFVNDVTRLHPLVDKKKVIITEATIRDALRLADAEGDLSLHSTKYFSLALTQKVFANMRGVGKGFSGVDTPLFEVHVDAVLTTVDEPTIQSPTPPTQPAPPSQDQPSTSLVQPTPPQSPQAQSPSPQQQPQPSQDANISMDLLHNLLDTCTTLTRRVTNLEYDKIAQALEISKLKQRIKKLEKRNKLKVSRLRRLKKVGTAQRVETSDDTVMDVVSKQRRIITDKDTDVDVTLEDIAKEVVVAAKIEKNADVQEPVELQEVVEVVTTAKLITEVVTVASATITAAAPQLTTAAAPTLTTAPSAARKRKEVVIRDPEETTTPSTIIHTKAKSKNNGKGILEKEDNVLMRYQALKRKPQTEAQARKNMMIYLKNVVGFKMDYFKGMTYDDIRPIFEKKFNSNEKLDEEVEELRKHLQIVPNDDDVYTEATPLALKVPVIDYEIYTENNKPYYKIKRADGTHQLYLCFLNMLRNFNREDLEVLWQLVKERFASSKPKNFSDDFLLTTLGAMFEKPDVQSQIWKNQRSVHGLAKVKSWKLLESCGVQIITFTTTQLILLVAGREEISTYKVHSRANAQQSLELMLIRTSRKTCQLFKTAGERLNATKSN